jgi:hypothetical protein
VESRPWPPREAACSQDWPPHKLPNPHSFLRLDELRAKHRGARFEFASVRRGPRIAHPSRRRYGLHRQNHGSTHGRRPNQPRRSLPRGPHLHRTPEVGVWQRGTRCRAVCRCRHPLSAASGTAPIRRWSIGGTTCRAVISRRSRRQVRVSGFSASDGGSPGGNLPGELVSIPDKLSLRRVLLPGRWLQCVR